MDYFSILNLNKEPFSNSPDPEYFFQSQQHLSCLQKLELSIRLRRGLNVVIGDVGAGKTTLCRQIIRRFDADEKSETHLILDPYFNSPLEFLKSVAGRFSPDQELSEANEWQIKEAIKQYLFKKGVDEQKTVVLIIDEGQKIPEFCLEILREFLNFETNEYKLLQIVIFAQREFEKILNHHANVMDRINLYHLLGPLDFKDTREMINFRIDQSRENVTNKSYFSFAALWAIYRITAGYPRRIVNLCHKIMLTMIIQNRTRAGYFLVRSCARREFSSPVLKWHRIALAVFAVILTASIAIGLAPEKMMSLARWEIKPVKSDVKKNVVHIEINEVPGREAEQMIASAPMLNLQELPRKEEILPNPGNNDAGSTETATAPDPQPVEPVVPVVAVPPPSILGKVALQRNETLWRLIVKVYGIYDKEYLGHLKAANPDIKNPDRIKAGRMILIPAVPLPVEPEADIHWIKISEKKHLAEALQVLRTYPKDAPPIRIVPFWDGEKLNFPIVLREIFSDKAVATERISLLPEDISGAAVVLSSWDAGAIFFADPNWKPNG